MILLVATCFGLTSCEYKNGSQLNQSYRNVVGRPGAMDRTSGREVTTFRRDANLYQVNVRLDRDKDGIACEKR